MNTMYVYDVDSSVVVAIIKADSNQVCEQIAADRGFERDELGWAYNSNGLAVLTSTETIEANE